MKKECVIRFVEFYKTYEKTSYVRIYLDEQKEIEQIKIVVDSYKNLKKFSYEDYQGILFVKAVVYNEDKDVEFEFDGDDYEKIKNQK